MSEATFSLAATVVGLAYVLTYAWTFFWFGPSSSFVKKVPSIKAVSELLTASEASSVQ